MKPRVFVPQVPSRYDREKAEWRPTISLRPAERFGEVVVLLPPQASRAHALPNVIAMREQLRAARPEDWLVGVGDPTLIAAAATMIMRFAGGNALRMLKWDRLAGDYVEMEIPL